MFASEHLPNGVRAYHGDNPIPFSQHHRLSLGREHYKMDLDHVEFVHGPLDTEGSVFHGYMVESNRFATVAVFDLKETHSAIFCDHNRVRHMYQVSLCRSIHQPVPPVFAYVVGDGPFLGYRVDLDSGAISDAPVSLPVGESWLSGYEELGVLDVRRTLGEWLCQK